MDKQFNAPAQRVEIYLVYNPLTWDPHTWLSFIIRVFTCSKRNHVAIRVDNEIIEAAYPKAKSTPREEWLQKTNRQVLPLIPLGPVNVEALRLLVGQRYPLGDLLQVARHRIATRWFGRDDWSGKDYPGLICPDFAEALLGIKGYFAPCDFENMPGLGKGVEFKTYKLKK